MPKRTVGVEEELLLVNPADGVPAAVGEQVVAEAGARRGERGADPEQPPIEHEFKAEQAEIGSRPTTSADELANDLRRLRHELASVAAANGVQLAAAATSPRKVRPTPTPDRRYRDMIDEFGLLARQQLTCGQHVHVSIESRGEGVAVLDRIAPWLPLITAISSNSPYWQGQDSGYQSYRTVVWALWPTAGPTAGFGDERGYDAAIADLLSSGAAMDDGMIYFDARLSAHYPTVEIRVADVCTDVDDAVLVAVLCRALVDTASADWRSGAPAPAYRPELLRAAAWRSARHGLRDELFDPLTRRVAPAFDVLRTLAEFVGPALEANGDSALVAGGLDRLRQRGTGADQQRRAHSARGDLHDVVLDVVRRTLG
ncbi:carboxylate-amine ligase [Nakamurella panacisegetis]|uniref:Putative glutamate--cysteine ligase 2 n=1 Tax=Nakamurella panacisegetis TaxID=1090615 RepID=A0A1H0KF81_9ACTN|nr:glutamate--cysteine ligase [Nakamurella panacisegetis]SDO54411.1 carboxylate-amine ligase [Nakamurella panacisegetis]